MEESLIDFDIVSKREEEIVASNIEYIVRAQQKEQEVQDAP